jgi:hypothetical protein
MEGLMEITKDTRVSDILAEYGDIADVMEAFGVKRVGHWRLKPSPSSGQPAFIAYHWMNFWASFDRRLRATGTRPSVWKSRYLHANDNVLCSMILNRDTSCCVPLA